jgi:hypothetical protein
MTAIEEFNKIFEDTFEDVNPENSFICPLCSEKTANNIKIVNEQNIRGEEWRHIKDKRFFDFYCSKCRRYFDIMELPNGGCEICFLWVSQYINQTKYTRIWNVVIRKEKRIFQWSVFLKELLQKQVSIFQDAQQLNLFTFIK